VVSARRRDHPYCGNLPAEQAIERAARLERARVLQELQLEDEANAGQPEVRAVDGDHGCAANMGGESCGRGADGRGFEEGGAHGA
jgi:hypothetical protein